MVTSVSMLKLCVSTDLESWTSIELNYKLHKRLRVTAEEQLRLKSDISEVDQYYSQLGVTYRITRRVNIDGGCRWIRRNDTQGKIQGYESRRRYHVSASLDHKFGRFDWDTRVRFQSKEEVGVANPAEPDRHLRFRVQVRYNFPGWKLDPVLSAELYRAVGDELDPRFDKIRWTLGTDWNTWRGGEMGLFYRLEKELGVDAPQTTHIVGLSFSHSLN